MPERILPSDPLWWPAYGWEHLQRYAFAGRHCRAGTGLDFGCGIGYGTEILARSGAARMVGYDLDAGVIAAARARPHPDNVQFFDHLAAGTVPGGFDFAVMLEVVEHLSDPAGVLAELAGHLKPGAILVISAPNRLRFTGAEDPVENSYHLSEPTYAELQQWLQPHFTVGEEYEQSDLRLDGLDYATSTLRQSWTLRLERGLRRLLGRPLQTPTPPDPLVRTTDLLPLILERRQLCRQFLFVARRKP